MLIYADAVFVTFCIKRLLIDVATTWVIVEVSVKPFSPFSLHVAWQVAFSIWGKRKLLQ